MTVLRTKQDGREFYRIPLSDGRFGYARMLPSDRVAIYDLVTHTPCDDIEMVESRDVWWRVIVHDDLFKRWTLIGAREVTGHLAHPVPNFMQSRTNYLDCTIFDGAGGSRLASPEECVGLERSSVWDPEAIGARILDRVEGRENPNEARGRVRLQPGAPEQIAQMMRDGKV